jgi:hypothetical protein
MPRVQRLIDTAVLTWCSVLRLLAFMKRGVFGSGKAQTEAIPGGIASICNTARAEKTPFYVPDSANLAACRAFGLSEMVA